VAQRKSRKQRKQRQRAARVDPASAAETPRPAPSGYARGREKDAAARAALVPLGEGERPRAVTVGAILAAFLGLTNLIAYVAGMEVQGKRPALPGVVIFTGLMLMAAYGMWRVRYWAVLGMQALLGLIILIFSLLAVKFENIGELLIAVAVVGSAGTLFWFLVKSMARIQMPERPGS
jgi:hypothetical protein